VGCRSFKQGLKVNGEYSSVKEVVAAGERAAALGHHAPAAVVLGETGPVCEHGGAAAIAAAAAAGDTGAAAGAPGTALSLLPAAGSTQLSMRYKTPVPVLQPEWHAPWKLMRVISGHLGWVRAVAVDPANQWFATGAGDRTIKIWDMAAGTLKLTLTGHISTIRGLAGECRTHAWPRHRHRRAPGAGGLADELAWPGLGACPQ
jgi:WD40 repeat protein